MYGNRIREARKKKGMTLKQVADATGYTIGHISQIERNLKSPSLSALRKIAACLESVSYTHLDVYKRQIELHPENVTPRTLHILKEAGITKLSIGIQSFQKKFQKLLGRTGADMVPLKAALSQVPFETVSMDFIFALPSQTFGDLKADVDAAFEAGANHVALYPVSYTHLDVYKRQEMCPGSRSYN